MARKEKPSQETTSARPVPSFTISADDPFSVAMLVAVRSVVPGVRAQEINSAIREFELYLDGIA